MEKTKLKHLKAALTYPPTNCRPVRFRRNLHHALPLPRAELQVFLKTKINFVLSAASTIYETGFTPAF